MHNETELALLGWTELVKGHASQTSCTSETSTQAVGLRSHCTLAALPLSAQPQQPTTRRSRRRILHNAVHNLASHQHPDS